MRKWFLLLSLLSVSAWGMDICGRMLRDSSFSMEWARYIGGEPFPTVLGFPLSDSPRFFGALDDSTRHTMILLFDADGAGYGELSLRGPNVTHRAFEHTQAIATSPDGSRWVAGGFSSLLFLSSEPPEEGQKPPVARG